MDPPPLRLLCIEPRFPGRLGAVADWLVRRRGYRCQFYCNRADPQTFWPESINNGLEVIPFQVGGVAREPGAAWTRLLERGGSRLPALDHLDDVPSELRMNRRWRISGC